MKGHLLLLSIWCFSVVFISQLLISLLFVFTLGSTTAQQTVPLAINRIISYALAIIILIWATPRIIRKWQKPTREELGLKSTPTWIDIGLAPVGYIAALLLGSAAVWLFKFFPWFNAEETQNIGFSDYLVGPDRAIVFIILALIAPIAEEIIFRGWLYGKMRSKSSAPLSILLTSLTFACLHGEFNTGVVVFCLSVVLCVLREITGTIYAGILVHILNNCVALFVRYNGF